MLLLRRRKNGFKEKKLTPNQKKTKIKQDNKVFCLNDIFVPSKFFL